MSYKSFSALSEQQVSELEELGYAPLAVISRAWEGPDCTETLLVTKGGKVYWGEWLDSDCASDVVWAEVTEPNEVASAQAALASAQAAFEEGPNMNREASHMQPEYVARLLGSARLFSSGRGQEIYVLDAARKSI